MGKNVICTVLKLLQTPEEAAARIFSLSHDIFRQIISMDVLVELLTIKKYS